MPSEPGLRVAVSQRVVESVSTLERRDALAHDWAALLRNWAATPLLVPNAWEDVEGLLSAWPVDAILLTGGNTPAHPDDPAPEDWARERDATETRLLDIALRQDLPLLGVCRGAQMINVYFGGRLSGVVPRHAHRRAVHGIQPVHEGGANPPFRACLVNSYHDQCIRPADLAEDLVPFANALDGSVEAFHHRVHRVMGVLWHPERKGPRCPELDQLLAGFLRGRLPWRRRPAALEEEP